MSVMPPMRPGLMTDGEINTELKTATGERLAELEAERAERRADRAAWTPDLSVGWKGLTPSTRGTVPRRG
jgi:hypothetical protein